MGTDKTLIENIMRQIWTVEYHRLNHEWPSPKDIPTGKIITKGKEKAA